MSGSTATLGCALNISATKPAQARACATETRFGRTFSATCLGWHMLEFTVSDRRPALKYRSYLSFIFKTRPSENTTFPVFPPENPTGAPFLEGARVIVIWSPGLIEILFQPFRCRMPGL